MSDVTLEQLNKELEDLSAAICEKEQLLESARMTGVRHWRRSDTGWLLSALSDQVGTLVAVVSGKKARKWREVIRKLEEEILLLKVDQKLKQKEIEAATKQAQ